MAHDLVLYQKPTCTTCRRVYALLKARGVDVEAVNYYLDPIPRAKLVELLAKMQLTPRELLRTTEPIYRELGLAKATLSDDAIVDLMVAHPDLIQRPIVERGDRAILGRPVERIEEIL